MTSNSNNNWLVVDDGKKKLVGSAPLKNMSY